MLHPGRANVSKDELETRLAEKFKVKKGCCAAYGLKTKFGGGKSTGFALVYDNEDIRKKYDSVPRLRKVRSVCDFILLDGSQAQEGNDP